MSVGKSCVVALTVRADMHGLGVACLLQDMKAMREARRHVRSNADGATAPGTMVMRARTLWLQWVGANAFGELAGLGGVVVAVAALASLQASPSPLVLFAGMVALGAMEGAVVGASQWLVVRQVLSALHARVWIAATALGAAAAWALGMLPSTIMTIAGSTGPQSAPPDIPTAAQVGLAAALGAVAGAVLAVFQWRALRRHVRHAIWWIPANAVAWALGMPLLFRIAGSAPPEGVTAAFAVEALVWIAAVGGVVGAVHGLSLVRLVFPRRRLSLVYGGPTGGDADELERDTRRRKRRHTSAAAAARSTFTGTASFKASSGSRWAPGSALPKRCR